MKYAEKVIDIAKNRGFFWPACEIYPNSPAGFWVYGPLGTMMKNKFLEMWRKELVRDEEVYEIETTNILPKSVFIASGHIPGFVDKLTVCKKCKNRFRADHLIEDQTRLKQLEGLSCEELTKLIKQYKIKCPRCGGYELGDVVDFQLMFKADIGAEAGEEGYFRPETTQGTVVELKQTYRTMRGKLPFSIAQTGHVFRNEISPRQSLVRMREFQQAEIQIFFDPEKPNYEEKFKEIEDYRIRFLRPENRPNRITEEKAADVLKMGYTINPLITYWLAKLQKFFNKTLGFPIENIRYKELTQSEKAHYSKMHWDLELYSDDFGWVEIANNAYRTDHDLRGHERQSGEKMEIFDVNRNVLPHMYEPSIGVDRVILHYLLIFFREDEKRHWFAFPKQIAPYVAAVFPLLKRDGLDEKAKNVFKMLKKEFDVFYDEIGSIGKRYARADEIGVPYCITVDHKTLEDGTVTIRNRDTTEQRRIHIDEIPIYLEKN